MRVVAELVENGIEAFLLLRDPIERFEPFLGRPKDLKPRDVQEILKELRGVARHVGVEEGQMHEYLECVE